MFSTAKLPKSSLAKTTCTIYYLINRSTSRVTITFTSGVISWHSKL